MDAIYGAGKSHTAESKLNVDHQSWRGASIATFWQVATIGSLPERAKFEKELEDDVTKKYNAYVETNRERNPWKNIEPFLLPVAIGVCAWYVYVREDSMLSICPCASVSVSFPVV
jgi:hypothetical protein